MQNRNYEHFLDLFQSGSRRHSVSKSDILKLGHPGESRSGRDCGKIPGS